MPLTHLVAIFVLVLLAVSIRRRRENFLHNLRVLMVSGLAGLLTYTLANGAGWNQNQAAVTAFLVAALALLLAPRRSRRIPAHVKRRVISRWQAETGMKYNSRRWEIDHIVPFSQGGSNTEDNLRVISKKRNRSKGGKPPNWDLLGR